MEPPTVQKNKIECKMTFRNEEPHVNKCFPRIRGDVPNIHVDHLSGKGFSPHTRGCSWVYEQLVSYTVVFPAYAGMFRSSAAAQSTLRRFPRIRGDVPPPTDLL